MWAVFCELSPRRASTGFGFAPLGWSDLNGWQAAYRAQLTPWETERILALDECWMKTQAEAREKKDAADKARNAR